jgi:hypothetical protein
MPRQQDRPLVIEAIIAWLDAGFRNPTGRQSRDMVAGIMRSPARQR